MTVPNKARRSSASLSDKERRKLKRLALESPHVHLVFADSAGRLRDLAAQIRGPRQVGA